MRIYADPGNPTPPQSHFVPSSNGAPAQWLTLDTVRRHLSGELTIGIYAINPATQRSKWMAIEQSTKSVIA
jgi:hypothetical protein